MKTELEHTHECQPASERAMPASPFKYTTSALQLEIINKKLFNNFNEDGLKLRHAAKEQKKH